MKKNGKSNFYELLNDESIVSKSVKAVMMKNLKNDEKTGGFKVEEIIKLKSFKSFDFTLSYYLVIRNVLYKLDDDKYDKAKYEYCKQLKNIRNEKYAHLAPFDVDDIDLSVAIATIEEVIRQLCDSNLSQDYLKEVKVELNKDKSEINNLKSELIELLAEQKEEFQTFIGRLKASLSDSTDSAIRSLGEELKYFISAEVVKSQKNLFIQLIERMKEREESRNLMVQVDMKEFHEHTEKIKQIDSKTSRIDSKTSLIDLKTSLIDSKTSRIELNTSEIIEIIKKPGIELASHLPPCPPASKLYNRENESEIFLELAKHKLSCIAGMAGVGKSTLAITYGHHRKEERNAKVFIFFKIFLLIPS